MARPHVERQLRREQISVRVPAWVKTWLESQPNQGKAVEQALIKANNLKPPD